MKTPQIVRILAFAAVGGMCIALTAAITSASGDPCPNAEVVFARGTGEPPGLGWLGEEFVNSLRARLAPKSVGVYAVNYPATTDFPTALDGINDAGGHVEQTAASCPNTKMVLGGYSQGAAVMGFVTANAVPDGAPDDAPRPMPPQVADHVAAVTLFGKPAERFMGMINQPTITIGPLYAAKTLELCVPNDPICSDGGDWAAHNADLYDGVVDQAVAFAATRV